MILHGEIQTRVFFQKRDLSFDSFELTLKLSRPTCLGGKGLSLLGLHQALHGPAQPAAFSEEADAYGWPCWCPLRLVHFIIEANDTGAQMFVCQEPDIRIEIVNTR